MIPYRKLFSLGILSPKESEAVKKLSQIFDVVLLFVVFWLPIQWYAEYQHQLTPEFINVSAWIVWSIFVFETIVMLICVQERLYYLQTNWLNLLIIVAIFPPMVAFNNTYIALFRYIRFIVLLRLILPQLANLHRILSRNRFGATLIAFLIVTLLGGILMSFIDPGIGSPWQGIWWAWQTVTTVGYGDLVPDTLAGRLFAAVVMLLGVAMFSLVSANLAAYFIERGQRQKGKKPERQVQKQFRELHERLGKIEDCHKRIEDILHKHLIMKNIEGDQKNDN